MKQFTYVLFALMLGMAMALPAPAQTGGEAAMPPFVKDYLGQVDFVQGHITALQQAMTEKAAWRPMEGVRSVAETYLHIAFGNYAITQMMGFEPPAEAKFSMDIKKWDSQTTDMAKIAEILNASFDHVRSMAKKLSAADLEKTMNLFGTDMTWRNGLISVLTHMHEHLGQSIAYARSNSVVPPWTAAEQAAEKAKMEKEGK